MDRKLVLEFRIWGEFGHFKRFYTTSSPLTFSFPPPPTVRGMVGALLGFGKEEYIEKTNPLEVGIGIELPVKKIRLGINLIDTKRGKKFDPTLRKKNPRTQVLFEFLKDVSFRIFISGEKKLLNEIVQLLKEHRTTYTLSLGLSECIADFSYVGLYEIERSSRSKEISTVVPVENLVKLNLNFNQKVMKEKIPTAMDSDRKTLEFKEVLFNPEGGKLKGEFRDVWRIRETGESLYLFAFPSK